MLHDNLSTKRQQRKPSCSKEEDCRRTQGRSYSRLDHTEGPPNGGTSSVEPALGRNRDVVIILYRLRFRVTRGVLSGKAARRTLD
jgi:hypothetical protein